MAGCGRNLGLSVDGLGLAFLSWGGGRYEGDDAGEAILREGRGEVVCSCGYDLVDTVTGVERMLWEVRYSTSLNPRVIGLSCLRTLGLWSITRSERGC